MTSTLPDQYQNGKLQPTPELDGIRGWACLSVLIAHCVTGVAKADPGSLTQTFNSHTLWLFLSGVDLFFVLSGFLIGGILLDSRNKPNYFSNFWIRRIGRIFPVAYLLLFTYAIALAVTAYFDIAMFNNWLLAEPRPPLWTFATFTQSIPIALGGYGGPRWMGITWSLAIEEQFYVLFPFVVLFMPRKYLVWVVLAGLIIAPILRDVLDRYFGNWYAPYVLLPSRVDALMYGVAVALVVRTPEVFAWARRHRLLLDGVALVLFLLIVGGYRFDFWLTPSGFAPLKMTVVGIMWALVVLRVFTYERNWFNKIWRNRSLAGIGLISYALYMYHQAVNGLMHGLLFNQEPTISTWAHLIAALGVIGISIGLAILSYFYFEKPIRVFAHRLADGVASRRQVSPVERLG